MMIMWQAGGQSGNTSGIISASIGSTSSIRVGLQLLFSGRYTCQISLPESQTEVNEPAGVILMCTASGSVPEGMMITWQAGGQSGNTTDTRSARTGSTAYLSIAEVAIAAVNDFICRVTFEAFQTNVNEPEDKGNGLHENLYRANHKESSLQRAQTILTSMVIGLNASEVSVQWVKNALLEGRHVNPRVLKGSIKDSLLALSQVVVPYSDWNNGTSYSCTFTRTAGTVEPTQRPEEKSQGEK
ncbi:---NA--- [Podarcis lilfordi]|uniref:---NA n=1 Tax=Podarcis lilfordi TaxID=74358 RepID=A0AA35L8T3_9SAUR|nr:---NA--- [Podarcis lilfordi]